MNMIVAVDAKWGVGKRNGLLFDIPADMKYFREKTLHKTVVMGYNTLLSLPGGKPLKNRRNIVLCPDEISTEGVERAESLDALKGILGAEPDDDVFVIGGATVYNLMLPYVKRAFITKVDADGGAEVFIKDLDKEAGWTLVHTSESFTDNGYSIRFLVYENNNPAKISG